MSSKQWQGFSFVDPYDLNLNKASLKDWLYSQFKPGAMTISDTETDGLRWYQGNNVIGVNFGNPTSKVATFVPCDGYNADREPLFTRHELLEIAYDIINRKVIIGQNYGFDYKMFRANGFDLYESTFLDTMLMAYEDNENRFTFKLEALCNNEIYNDADVWEKELLKVQDKKKGLANAPWEQLFDYSCGDIANTWNLFAKLFPKLKEQGLLQHAKELSRYMIDLAEMEMNGIKIDAKNTVELNNKLANDCNSMYDPDNGINIFGCNPSSPAQVKELFNLPNAKKETLQDNAFDYPLLAKILEYKQKRDLATKFCHQIAEFSDAKGYIRPNFNIVSVVTPRISCSEPNLMNIPRRNDELSIKNLFTCEDDEVLVSIDYSQIELRMLAHLSGEEKLIVAYQENRDIHSEVATELGVPRIIAKNVNFGLPFGMGPFKFCEYLPKKDGKRDIELATKLFKGYGIQYPKVRKYHAMCQVYAKSKKRIKYWTGCYRNFRGIEHQVHKAMPNIVQGSAGEIYRIAINRCIKHFKDDSEVRLVLQVHDELLFVIKKHRVKEVVPIIVGYMEDFNFIVPIKVEVKIGTRWGQCNSIGETEYAY